VVNLTKAKISGNIITYPEVLHSIDLIYTVTSTGVSKQVVLKDQSALASDLTKIDLEIRSNKKLLAPVAGDPNNPNGDILVEGKSGLKITRPITFDQSIDKVQVEKFAISPDSRQLSIFPNQSFLTDPSRQFPIVIDPDFTAGIGEDTFVSPATGSVVQGGTGPRKPTFVGDYNDTAVPTYYYNSRSLLKFAPINQGVISAKLGVYSYGTTSRQPFTADIRSVGDFSEWTAQWNNQPGMGGDYGDLYFPGLTQDNYSYVRESSDLTQLVNEQIGSSVKIALKAQNEDFLPYRGAVFCSKDWQAAHCSGKAPYLWYRVNNRPNPANSESPDNAEFGLGCDLSALTNPQPAQAFYPPSQCRFNQSIPVTVSNINDGDHASTDPATKAQTKLAGIDYANNPSYYTDLTPYYPASSYWWGIQSWNADLLNGNYNWGAINRDEYGLESYFGGRKRMSVDASSPVQIQPFNLPTSTRSNQIEFKFPNYTDNFSSKVKIHLKSNPDLVVQSSGNRGFTNDDTIHLWPSQSTFNQEWIMESTGLIRGTFGRCIDYNPGLTNPQIKLFDCHGAYNQQWYYDVNTQEIKAAGITTASGKAVCLDGVYSQIGNIPYLFECTGGVNQKWEIEKIEKVRLRFVNSDFAVDIKDANPANSTNVQVWQNNDSSSQWWTLNPNGQIYGGQAGKCLTMAGTVSAGINIHIWDCVPTSDPNFKLQQWEVTAQNEIRAKGTNLCVDGSYVYNGQNVYLWNCQGGNNQKFSVEPFQDIFNSNWRLSYDIQVATSSDFNPASIIYEGWQNSPVFQYACGARNPDNSFDYTTCLQDSQTYYFRFKVRDRRTSFDPVAANKGNISNWSNVASTTIDSVPPKVKDLNLTQSLISPTNPTSIGILDTTDINYKFLEKTFNRGEVGIYRQNQDGTTTLVRTITNCYDKNNQLAACVASAINNNYGTTSPIDADSNWTPLRFVFDGKDNAGKPLDDGQYKVVAQAYDDSNNSNDITLSTSNSFVTIDNTGANINISSPVNGFWTNENQVAIAGSVAGFNQAGRLDSDFAKLEVSIDGQTWTDITSSVDSNLNFSYSLQLNSNAQSKVYLQTTDQVGNVINKIGNPLSPANLQSYWVINQDLDRPNVVSLNPQGVLTQGQNNKNPKLEIKLKDTLPGSGLTVGTNPKGYDISLLKIVATNPVLEIPLFRDGVNVTTGTPKLAGDLTCNLDATVAGGVICTSQLTNLADGIYKIYVRFRDITGNLSCNQSYTIVELNYTCGGPQIQNQEAQFTIDTSSYFNLDKPINGSTVATSIVEFAGKGEKDGLVTVKNAQLNRRIEFKLDTITNNWLPKEYIDSTNQLVANTRNFGVIFSGTESRLFSQNDKPLTISCGQFIDEDNNPDTTDIEICSFSVFLKQVDNYQLITNPKPSARLNQNTASLVSSTGNIVSQPADLNVDLYTLNLSSKSDRTVFSPNGDGKFDQVTFTNSATKAVDNTEFTDISSFTIQIKDSQNQVVYTQTQNNPNPGQAFSLQSGLIFDGKANSGSNSGQYLANGNYSYTLNLVTATGLSVATNPQTITAKVDLTGEVSILSPLDNYTTTRSVINVQGQGPASNGNNKWNVEICVDTQTATNTVACDFSKTVSTDQNGFYSAIVVLPATATTHKITAVAKDNNGNLTPVSNIVNVKVDTSSPFNDVKAVQSFYGVNSKQDIDNFIAGNLSIDKLRTLQLQSFVTANTEAVDIDFADYSNLNTLPNTDPNTGYSSFYNAGTKIASLNEKQETRLNLNPIGDPTIKFDHFARDGVANGKDIQPKQVCTNPTAQSGIPDSCSWAFNYPYPFWLGGGTYELRFRGYKDVAVQDLTRAISIDGQLTSAPRLLRVDKISGTNNLTANNIQNKFYTNTTTNKLWGVADPNSTIQLKIKNEKLNTEVSFSATSNTAGIWSVDSSISNLDGDYTLEITATKGASTTKALETYILVLDTKAAELNWVETSSKTNSQAVNPWINSTDLVQFVAKTNEPIINGGVFGELGFNASLDRVVADSTCIDRQYTDTQCQLDLIKTQEFKTELAVLRPLEGIYYPTFYLEDLAGNKVWYSNNPDLATTIIDPFDVNNSDPKVVLDPTNPADPKFAEIVNGNPVKGSQPLPVNYPYSQTNRGKSLDFRLIVDNFKPEQGEWLTPPNFT